MNAYGTLIAPDTVQFERLLPGPIERAWSYIVDSEKRSLWLSSGPIEPRVGGRVEMTWDNSKLADVYENTPPEYQNDCDGNVTGEVLVCDKPRLLTMTWGHKGSEPSEVTFELTPQGQQVLLTLTHRRLKREEMGAAAPGWHTHLDLLAEQLSGRPNPPFWSKFLPLRDEYAKRLGTDSPVPAK
jgi:uncharacterized protein YndB with AHSA1/START domain